MSEVWFAIPSASVERCRERLPVWRERGYRIAVLQNQERGEIPADVVVWSDTYPGWAESVNILCREIVPASADLVVSGGDDMLPEPSKTAAEMASEYFERFPDGFGVMQPCGDGFMWAENYCGSPWFARPYFESMYGGRGPMWGGYRHNWADYELYWVARCLGVLWMRDDVAQYHAHFTREGEETPAWWQENVKAADREDCERFLARKYRYFPGHEPLGRDTVFNEAELLQHERGVAEWRWNRSYSPHSIAGMASDRMTQALAGLSERRIGPVAIYGAGSHTHRAAHALASPAADIVAIADDDESRHGTKLWGYPIVSLDDLGGLGVRAVVLSSDAFEDQMYDRCAALRGRGIEVLKLYDQAPAEVPA